MPGPARNIPVLSAVLSLLAALALPAAADDAQEYSVKAAYLSKFGSYVEWPRSSFAAADSAINLCVAGEDPFGAGLDAAAAGHRIGDRPIAVRHLTAVTANTGCQILFVGGSDPHRVAQILKAAGGEGVLTVTDAANGDDAPCIIRFVIRDDHVRFSIDDDAASRNGITVSSRLLSLALSVNPRAQAGEAHP